MAIRLRKVNADTRTTVNLLEKDEFAALANVNGIAVSANGTVYGVDFANHVVYKIYEDGRTLGVVVGKLSTSGDVDSRGVAGSTGNDARLDSPFGTCVDASDNVWIADRANRKIKRLSPSGRCVVVCGDGTAGDSIGDVGTAVKLSNALSGICVDKSGILYVADRGNHKIKKLWHNGMTRTLAGSVSGFTNGNGTAARFNDPMDCCVDKSGNVYVADRDNNSIRKINQNGDVTILAGGASGAGTPGFVDGNGIAARFSVPIRVAMDPSGQFLYVMDSGNSAIRKVTASGQTTTFMSYGVSGQLGDIDVDNSGFLYVLENV